MLVIGLGAGVDPRRASRSRSSGRCPAAEPAEHRARLELLPPTSACAGSLYVLGAGIGALVLGHLDRPVRPQRLFLIRWACTYRAIAARRGGLSARHVVRRSRALATGVAGGHRRRVRRHQLAIDELIPASTAAGSTSRQRHVLGRGGDRCPADRRQRRSGRRPAPIALVMPPVSAGTPSELTRLLTRRG